MNPTVSGALNLADPNNDPGIWQVPREGSDPVNLSAITMEGPNDGLGGFCLNTG